MMYLDTRQAFEAPHLLTPRLSDRANFALGHGTLFATGTAGVTSVIPKHDIEERTLYLLGVLNSSLLSFYAVNHSTVFQGGYRKFSGPYLKRLPIRRINFGDPKQKRQHDQIVALVEEMLQLQQEYAEADILREDRRLRLKDRIDKVDQDIDQAVFELYGLTEEEIKIVKGEA